MKCRTCHEAAEPDLYSLLPRRLALDLVCDRLADVILSDELFIEQTREAFRRHLDTLTHPEPGQAEAVQREIDSCTRKINFILDAPGDTDQDQKENQERLRELRSDRAAKQTRLAEIEEAAEKTSQLPDSAELSAYVQQIKATLREAARSDDPAELAALQDLIKDLTGGQIWASQQGEKARKQGWVRLTFQVNALRVLARHYGFPDNWGDSIMVEVDIQEPDWKDQKCEAVKELYDKEFLIQDIAEELSLDRNTVSELLEHWATKHRQSLPDNHARGAELRKKQHVPRYKAIADEAQASWADPNNLSFPEIGRQLGTSATMVRDAIVWWCRSRGLPVPSAKDQRERIMVRAKAMFDDHVEIKEIARTFDYAPHVMSAMIKEVFARNGEVMPDGRKHRHQRKLAG